MVLLKSSKEAEQKQIYNLRRLHTMKNINEQFEEINTKTDMAVHSVSPEALQNILGASHDIASDYFWQHESDDVFYCDGDKQTCIDSFIDVYSIKDLLQSCTLYFVPRDSIYYLVTF